MSTTTTWLDPMAALGRELPGRDLPCYSELGRDPTIPLPGGGAALARLCMFGRDPGRDEVRHGMPFIGAGGQKIRAALHEIFGDGKPLTLESSINAGRYVFWANTVPFKPLGNKAWSPKIVRSFKPPMCGFLLDEWKGTDVLTFGEVAFSWFGVEHDPNREVLDAHWTRDDRFETSVEVSLVHPATGEARILRVHPLPHPSPLNATWVTRFPGLLRNRLAQLRVSPDSWEMAPQ